MNISTELKSYFECEKEKLNSEFQKNKETTEELFAKVYDFLSIDFDELSDNRVYRCFLNSFKGIICFAFEQDLSKAYLRYFFKIMNDEMILKYLSIYSKSKAKEIRFIMSRFECFFIYSWQGYGNDKDKVLEEIMNFIDCWV